MKLSPTRKANIAFALSSSYIKQETPGTGPFWPKVHSLNKLGRGQLGDATNLIPMLKLNTDALGLVVPDKNLFYVSPI